MTEANETGEAIDRPVQMYRRCVSESLAKNEGGGKAKEKATEIILKIKSYRRRVSFSDIPPQ